MFEPASSTSILRWSMTMRTWSPDDGRGRPGRDEQPEARGELVAGKACLGGRRQVGNAGQALGIGDGKRLELSRLDVRLIGRDGVHHHVDAAREHVGYRLRRAL